MGPVLRTNHLFVFICTFSLALGASSHEVKAVVMQGEATSFGKLRQCFVELTLDRGRNGDVEHRAALFAQQVMVVSDQVFGQFEAAEFVVADDACHHARGFQHRQVAVDRALRQVIGETLNLLDRHRPAGRTQCGNECTARGCVALVRGDETRQHDVVEFAH